MTEGCCGNCTSSPPEGVDQHAIIGLKVSSNLAEGGLFIGGIKEQEPSQLGMLNGGDQRRVRQAFGKFDRDNNVVESAHTCGCFRRNRAAFVVDDHIERVHANFPQHRLHQRGFVLAVSVPVGEYLRGGVWLDPTNSQRDGDVAKVPLHELRQSPHLGKGSER